MTKELNNSLGLMKSPTIYAMNGNAQVIKATYCGKTLVVATTIHLHFLHNEKKRRVPPLNVQGFFNLLMRGFIGSFEM